MPDERDLKQKAVVFADNFRVQASDAFVGGTPQNAAGGEPDLSRTMYADRVDSGAFDNNLFVLLKK